MIQGQFTMSWRLMKDAPRAPRPAESEQPKAHWGTPKAVSEVGTLEPQKAVSPTKTREGLRS